MAEKYLTMTDALDAALREIHDAEGDEMTRGMYDEEAIKRNAEVIARHACEFLDRVNAPCADALDRLWKEVILARKPNYDDWEYPAMAYRHLKAEFDELAADRDAWKSRAMSQSGNL